MSLRRAPNPNRNHPLDCPYCCPLYTPDAADDRLRLKLGGRRLNPKIM